MPVFIVALLLLLQGGFAQQATCNVADASKVDCGYSGINQQQCESKGCCWFPVNPNPGNLPWCYYNSSYSSDCFVPSQNSSAPFSASEVNTMRGYWLANFNIDGLGGIVASPNTSVGPGGNYYYHWMRDAALSVRALINTTDPSTVETILKAYVGWVLNVQNEPDPNGIDVRTEPKFNLPKGDVFSGGWCRPQNDGPGLRATTLIGYARWLMANGQSSYVKQYLWTSNPNSYHGGAIKFDLDWVSTGYLTNGCDLWEEVQNTDFFWNVATQKYALLVGGDFAADMGDYTSANTYRSAAAKLSPIVANHWNGMFVQESNNRQKDSAVIVGFNDAYWAPDQVFSPTSSEVAATIQTLNSLFCSSYQINQMDSANGIPGVLYGRYQGDTYDGGNPWILLTAALGQLLYRGATAVLETGMPEEAALLQWKQVFRSSYDPNVHNNPLMLSRLFASNGDGPLWRIRAHVESLGFHLGEQIDRNNGGPTSATDLTWSYSEVLVAMHTRTQYIQLARKMYPLETEADPFFSI